MACFSRYLPALNRVNWIKLFSSGADARQRLTENKPQLVLIDGLRICLVLRGDRLFAIHDKCTHNGDSLSKGTINYLGDVVCPWHGYRFSLKTGREANEQSNDVAVYPIKEDEQGVFIGI